MQARMIDMPPTIKAFVKVTAEPEGDFETVVINARISHEEQLRSCAHERRHIEGQDFCKVCADNIEKEGHTNEK